MALTREQQKIADAYEQAKAAEEAKKRAKAIEESYQRAREKYDAQTGVQLKESAENLAMQLKTSSQNLNTQLRTSSDNLAMQTKQIGQLREQATVGAAQQGSQAYVNAQQQARVLPNQLTNAGLGQSGYRSLAQQKMAQSLDKNQKGINDNLGQQMSGYKRNEESNQLNYNQNVEGYKQNYNQNTEGYKLNHNQNVRSLNSNYAQNLADITLDRQQRLTNLEAGGVNNYLPTGYTPTGNGSQPPKTIAFPDMVKLANAGQYTYDQYKVMLQSSGVSQAEQNAYLKNFLYYQAKRDTPSSSGKVSTKAGEQYQ